MEGQKKTHLAMRPQQLWDAQQAVDGLRAGRAVARARVVGREHARGGRGRVDLGRHLADARVLGGRRGLVPEVAAKVSQQRWDGHPDATMF